MSAAAPPPCPAALFTNLFLAAFFFIFSFSLLFLFFAVFLPLPPPATSLSISPSTSGPRRMATAGGTGRPASISIMATMATSSIDSPEIISAVTSPASPSPSEEPDSESLYLRAKRAGEKS